ncbi:MAG: cell division protein SepF [Butyricicoccaceae bacterium]
MGLMNEFKRWVSGETDEDMQDEYEYADDQYEEPAPQAPAYSAPAESAPVAAAPRAPRASGNREFTVNATTSLKVVIVKIQEYKELTDVANDLKSKNTVVLNLETTDPDTAKRALDFLSGVTYALEGKIKRVAKDTYLITPYDVNIVGDDLLSGLESSGIKI